MKKHSALLPLMLAAICLFGACEKDVPFIDSISGEWKDLILPDGVNRIIDFDEFSSKATISSTSYAPDISEEVLTVPYTMDKKKRHLTIDFSGVKNSAGVSGITLQPTANKEEMLGTIRFSDPQQDDGSLFFVYQKNLDNEGDLPFPGAGELNPDDLAGPRSPQDELPPLGWENPLYPSDWFEGGPDNGVALSILGWAGEKLAEFFLQKAFDVGFDALWDGLFSDSSTNIDEAVNQIIKDLDVIKEKLQIIDEKIDLLGKQIALSEAIKNLTDRNDRYCELALSVKDTKTRIDLISKEESYTEEQKNKAISKAILEWGEETYHENKRYLSVATYVNKAVMASGNKPYPAIYDELAYLTNEWESDGYEWREMLRTTDQALICVTAGLTAMYWAAKHKDDPLSVPESFVTTYVKDLENTIRNMDKIYEANSIQYHYDQMICQILNLHIVFDKNIEWRDLKHPVWHSDKIRPYSSELLLYGTSDQINGDYLRKERFLTEAEYDKLSKYYAGYNGSLLSLLKEIGFNICTDDKDSGVAYMPLPNGVGWTKLSKTMSFSKAINNSSRKKEELVNVGIINDSPSGQAFNPDNYVKYYDHTWFNLRVLQRYN